MPTCQAPTLTEDASFPGYMWTKSRQFTSAFVLAELVVVIFIIALLVGLATLNTAGLLGKYSFKTQANELVATMQRAVTAAAQSDRRYEVILDIAEQKYILRQIITGDLSEVLDEEIMKTRNLGENCQLHYVQFDDLEKTDEDNEIARFRAGRAGWQYGGKIVLVDAAGNEYSIVLNRLNATVKLQDGDAELLLPKDKYEVPF